MRFRYSLRALLIVVTLIAIGFGWLAMPTNNARRFASAVQTRNYAAAERFFAGGKESFLDGWKKHSYFDPRVHLKPLTWQDILSGERNLVVAVSYGDGGGIASYVVEIKATAAGLQEGMAIP